MERVWFSRLRQYNFELNCKVIDKGRMFGIVDALDEERWSGVSG